MTWNGEIIIFDFEVFKFDTLLGAIVIKDNKSELFQIWDYFKIKQFFLDHIHSMWIGHNNSNYDNYIMDAIINNRDAYETSVKIINKKYKPFNVTPFLSYDLMSGSIYSLKATELVYGLNISETEVDFNIDRPLTEKEYRLTESYNKDDLNQTLNNFLEKTNFGRFKTRINILKEFNLDYSYLNVTDTKLASICLGAKHIDGIEYQHIEPPMYDFLKLNNQELLNFYKEEKFKKGEKIEVTICGVTHKLGDGGGHGALERCHFDKAIYCDVSGYYNLLMINLDLLPRTMPPESKQRYIDMYHEQLKLKKTAPERRQSYKTILLAVWGAMRNEYTDFYDSEKGALMTITGQLFIMDLLEKLEPYIILVQTNTDGIIIVPKDWKDEQLVLDIVKEWTERTGFTINPKYIFDIYQRDVNNYMYRDDEGNINCKGEALKHWNSLDNIFANKLFDAKEPVIIAKGIVNYFMNKTMPIDTIKEGLNDLRNFEYICKKNSYDYLEYEEENLETSETTTQRLQGVNRAFALFNQTKIGMIYKYKYRNNKLSRAKVSNLPDSVFVYDNEIMSDSAKNELINKINLCYYEDRIYERIYEFLDDYYIKDITIYE